MPNKITSTDKNRNEQRKDKKKDIKFWSIVSAAIMAALSCNN